MKRFLSVVVLSMLLVMVFSATVFAAEDVYSLVEEANQKIEEKIEEAVEKADELDPESSKYDVKLDKIINKLIKETDKISKKTIKEAKKKYGATVVCEYVEVQIGNRTVLVDPLNVSGW
ncbi:hypothetical protein R9X47_12680 [Wukongibacter baidiensis]|uniref:hypothetical protein n=1 Tax=Wukongibacter baidiensis TaxID=1723361 RepID=UPI003D7F8B56